MRHQEYINQEYFDDKGNVIKFIGAFLPLYITPEVLDFQFIEFLEARPAVMAEVMSKGGNITVDDKINILGGHADGRAILKECKEPSDIFIRDASAKPMLVKDYYFEDKGVIGTKRGVRPSVTGKDQYNKLAGAGSLLAGLFGGDTHTHIYMHLYIIFFRQSLRQVKNELFKNIL